MKNTREQSLFAEERQEQIVALLQQTDKLLVPELCDYFNVSASTIRNDLRDLSAQGYLKRTHGGAIPISKTVFEPSSTDKKVLNYDNKKQIALTAIDLIEEGDSIALDAGTTTFELAKLLCNKKNLTIVTNDIHVASYLEANSSHTIIILAGILRHGQQCAVGPLALNTMQSLNVDKAFLAANAFHIDKGFTTPDINQAEVKKAFLRSSSESIMLCDSSKMNLINFTKFAQLKDINKLVTDNDVPPQIRRYFDEQKDIIEVLYA